MGVFIFLIPIVAIVSVFTFVAVASWSDNRRKERETYYRHETYRKILEQGSQSAEPVLNLMRQEERQRADRRIEGLKLGGLITMVTGVGLFVFLRYVDPTEGVHMVGLIPLLIGLVLAFHGFFIARRPEDGSV